MNIDLLIPFQYEYMIKAILVSGAIGGVCALLSCFVVLKGWSLLGDALSHAVVPGVAAAYIIGIPFSIGAFISGMLAAFAMDFVKKRTRIREDAVIGIVYTTFFAAGVLLISLFPSNISLNTIIMGNILGIADRDIVQTLIVAGISLSVILLLWKDLRLFAFDAAHARAIGLNVNALHLLLLTLLAATAIAALETVGSILVVAMLVTPGAAAYLLTDRFSTMMKLSVFIGAVTSSSGAYISYFLNGSAGGCIVALQFFVFAAILFFAPRHGIIAARMRAIKSVKNFFSERHANGSNNLCF
ncbi:metal ABC transporter permease [Treponema parvum]|uniref:metal ABC transporter permease n=1 Tax=Treponema parvum TaxID=138851 RepID=UPI001AEC4B2B|nr:metal ABC transporter permease [Treponema parvum]QTQ16913.1 metal ABC transporter permease [Treponema parvum]